MAMGAQELRSGQQSAIRPPSIDLVTQYYETAHREYTADFTQRSLEQSAMLMLSVKSRWLSAEDGITGLKKEGSLYHREVCDCHYTALMIEIGL